MTALWTQVRNNKNAKDATKVGVSAILEARVPAIKSAPDWERLERHLSHLEEYVKDKSTWTRTKA